MTDRLTDEARSAARTGVDALIREVVRATDPGAIREVPIWEGASSTVLRPLPLPAITAAHLIAGQANGALRSAVTDARSNGHSWHAIGEAAGLKPDSPHHSLAEIAFEWACPRDEDRPYDQPYSYWRCGGPDDCGQWITDHGPYNPHPTDREFGHAEDCRRQAHAIAAWETEQDD